jgi:nicotinate-nucleotide--dimethylbenzimidazole phosphoribosyltransferase
MALGRKPENQVPQIGGTTGPTGAAVPPAPPAPPVPPPPAAPIDTSSPVAPGVEHPSGSDVVTALDARLQELQATVAALVDKAVDERMPATPPVAPGDIDVDDDVLEASKTLQLAKRTAEATIAEATTEAADLLASARSESEEILRAAHEAADRELSEQRTALNQQTVAWEARRRELVASFERLEGELAEQRRLVDEAEAVIRRALAGPTLSEEIPSIPEPPAFEPAPVAQPAAAEPEAAADAPLVDEPAESDDQVVTFAAPPDVETSPLFPSEPTPAPPVFGEAPAAAHEEVTFGTPPPPPTPFYPWNSDEGTGAEAGSNPTEAAPAEDKPVQRRGLFGH